MIGSIAIGCVAENTPKYLNQALRLLCSWRWYSAPYSNEIFYICIVNGVSDKYRKLYESYGASVHIVKPFSSLHPQSNKLRFLELPGLDNVDRVLLFDCDTVIVGDISDLIEGPDFIAKIADFPTVREDIFRTLFSEFKIQMPLMTERCTVHGEETIPYFNAGVLSFSKNAMNTLVPKWIQLNRELTKNIELLQDCKNFCEQASLSLALVSCGTRFLCLTNQYNFPAHCLAEPLDSPFANTDPSIIHYHWLTNQEGFLLPSPYPIVNRKIIDFNDRLSREKLINE